MARPRKTKAKIYARQKQGGGAAAISHHAALIYTMVLVSAATAR
jgi:hypothetical protein